MSAWLRTTALLTLSLAASCSCARDEQKDYSALLMTASDLQREALEADGGAARADGFERLAALYDALADLNDDHVERECSRFTLVKEKLNCKLGKDCKDAEQMCLYAKTFNAENAEWRKRAKEARDAAAKLRSSLPPQPAAE